MAKNFKEAVKHRRTYYNITNSSPISDNEIKEIIDFAVTNVPSEFTIDKGRSPFGQKSQEVLGYNKRSSACDRSG